MCPCEADNLPIKITFESFQIDPIHDVLLIDCRTEEEYEAGHLEGAILFPLQQLSVRVSELEKYRDTPIIIYCRTGNRSGTFARYLRTIGFAKCQSISEGYETWGDFKPTC